MHTPLNARADIVTNLPGASNTKCLSRFALGALSILVIAAVLFAPSAKACGPPPSYTLTLSISGNGSVNLNPPNATYTSTTVQSYSSGTSVTLTATPSAGYVFDHWGGDWAGSTNPLTITVISNLSITAVFVPQVFTLTTSVTGSGTISPNSGTTYSPGASVTVTASPSAGWRFDHWAGDLSGSTNPTTLTMNANKSVGAVFIQRFTLTATTTGTGTVAFSPTGGTYDTGTNVTVTATAGSGWRFDHWTGNLSGSTNPATVSMTANKSVTAVFIQRFTLSSGTYGMGSVTASPPGDANSAYDAGSSVSVTAVPAAGWRFDHWAVDLTGSTNPSILTMNANKMAVAYFIQRFTVTTATTGSGTISLSPAGGTYDSATGVTATATPAAGWRFDHWTGDLTGSTNPGALTMYTDKSVTAVFIQQFTMTTSVTGSGTVALSPTGGTYDTGTNVTVTATPTAGWRFDHWTGSLTGSANPATVAMTAAKSVTAVFIQQFTVTTATTGSGTVALSPAGGTYDVGTNVTVTATPAAGWRFDHWTGDLSGSTNPANIAVYANKSVTAVFIQRFGLNTATYGIGSITVSPPGDANSEYDAGTTITVTAVPWTGWRFDHWDIDLTGSTNPTTVTINSYKMVVAYFVPRYTVTTTTTGSGTVSLSPAGGAYDTATNVTLTATPAAGWRFDHWTGDLTGSTNPGALTMYTDKSVTAVFVQQFTMATSVTGSGTVALSPTGGTYDTGTNVTVTATPTAGWRFDHWTGSLTGSTNPAIVAMSANKSVTAVFILQFSATAVTTGSGTVSLSPSGGTYDVGTTVTATATPEAGWRFDRWTGDLTGSTNPATLAMYADKSFVAVFVKTFTLATAVNGSGAIALSPPGGVYDINTTVTLTPQPNSMNIFAGWTGALSGTTTPAYLTMTEDRSVTAVFTPLYSVNVTSSEGGSVQLYPPDGIYLAGTTVTVSAIPDEGWLLDHWEGASIAGASYQASLTMNGSVSLRPVFIRPTLTTSVNGVGSVLVEGKVQIWNPYHPTVSKRLTATPGFGWHFDRWESSDLSGSSNPIDIDMDQSRVYHVVAHFSPDQHTLHIGPQIGGVVQLDPPGPTYNFGTPVTLTATPCQNWTFQNWLTGTGDYPQSSNNPVVGFLMNSDIVVGATFAPLRSLITSVEGQGVVTSNPPGDLLAGDGGTVTVTATPAQGWLFDHWDSTLTTINDFEDPIYGFRYTGGSWSIVGRVPGNDLNRCFQTAPNVNYGSWIDSSQSNGDLTVEVSYRYDSGNNAFYVRPRYNNNSLNMLEAEVLPTQIALRDIKDGAVRSQTTCNIVSQPGQWYVLRIEATGSNVTVWRAPEDDPQSGATILTMSDATKTYMSYPQLAVAPNCQWSVDDFKITTHDLVSATRGGIGNFKFAFEFNDPDLTGLNPSPGWSVVSDPTSEHFVQNTCDTSGHSLARWQVYTDIDVELSYRFDQYLTPGQDPVPFYVIPRYDPNTGAHIELLIYPGPTGYMVLREIDAQGAANVLYTTSTVTSDPGTWYDLRIQAVGDKVSVWRSVLGENMEPVLGPVTVTETPTEWVQFYVSPNSQWSIDSIVTSMHEAPGTYTSTNNPLHINMIGNRELKAVFTQNQSATAVKLNTYVNGYGYVNLYPMGAVYQPGTVVMLTPQPAFDNWEFVGWTGDLSGSASPTILTMDSSKSVTAVFAERFPLYVIVGEGGSAVQLDPPGAGSPPVYRKGKLVHLTPVPLPGTDWVFSGWSGDLSGATYPGALRVDNPKTVAANFVHGIPLSVTVKGQGQVQITDEGTGLPVSPATCRPGATLSLTPIPAEGWAFCQWQGDLHGGANPASFPMTQGASVVAEFVERPGIATLDLVSDLGATLTAWNIEAAAETYDCNGVRYTDSGRVFIGNGMPDAAELYLLQAVLKRPTLDLAARSGVVEEFAWQAWTANLAQAQADLPNADPTIQRTVAGYMTIGDYITASSMKELVEANTGVILDINDYDRSQQQYLSSDHDADNDGATNFQEWQNASPDGSLTNLDAFANAALNYAAHAGGSEMSHTSANSSAATGQNAAASQAAACVASGTVTLVPQTRDGLGQSTASFESPTLPTQENPNLTQPQNLGSAVHVLASPDTSKGWVFDQWFTQWPNHSTITGSRNVSDSLRVMDANNLNLTPQFSRTVLYVWDGGDRMRTTICDLGEDGVQLPDVQGQDVGLDSDQTYHVIAGSRATTVKLSAASLRQDTRVYGWSAFYPSSEGGWDATYGDTVQVSLATRAVWSAFAVGPTSFDIGVRKLNIRLLAQKGGKVTGAEPWWQDVCPFVGNVRIALDSNGNAVSGAFIKAIPDPEYVFDRWLQCTPGTRTEDAFISPTITGDAVFEASFKRKEEYTLEIRDSEVLNLGPDNAAGYVIADTPGGRTKYYGRDRIVSLGAHPNPGYRFLHWDGDGECIVDSANNVAKLLDTTAPNISYPMDQPIVNENGKRTFSRQIWPVFKYDPVILDELDGRPILDTNTDWDDDLIPDDVALISAAPEMPRLQAGISGANSLTTTTWHFALTYNLHLENQNLTGDASETGGQYWDVDSCFGNEFAGGNATLTYTFCGNGPSEFKFRILGTNPEDDDVEMYLVPHMDPHWYIIAMFKHESPQSSGGRTEYYNQFNTSIYPDREGLPNWNARANGATLGGWGMVQLDPARGRPITRDEIWNWKTNIDSGIAVLQYARNASVAYFAAVQRTYPDEYEAPPDNCVCPGTVTPLNHIDASTICLYNGPSVSAKLKTPDGIHEATYRSCYAFDKDAQSGHRWSDIIPNSQDYVRKVMRAYEKKE